MPLGMDDRLECFARALIATGYCFVTPTPETYRRVNARPQNAEAHDLAGVFGWSRPFRAELLPGRLFRQARDGGALERLGAMWRSRYRVSTLAGLGFLHSAYPTSDPASVFFGPDTYRFGRALAASLPLVRPPLRAVDIGCGAGTGGILIARHYPTCEVILADINLEALRLARINARIGGVGAVAVVHSDVLTGLSGTFDLIAANPPYMFDALGRAYRHGGGALGEGLSLRIVAEAIPRLSPGGTLLLYTGVGIVGGANAFIEQAGALLDRAGFAWRAEEIDPDVFGEELELGGPMSAADRIAVLWLVATRPNSGSANGGRDARG